MPTPAGYQTPTTAIDFYTFVHVLQDGSSGVATKSPPPTVHNRLYVEVHNRGRSDAVDVRVTVASRTPPPGWRCRPGTRRVQGGSPLPGPKWITLGTVTLPLRHAGAPKIVAFDLPSTVLPMPASLPGNAHWCSVAFVHAAKDPFTGAAGNVDALTLADRKVAQKNLHIVPFVGTPPPPGTGIGVWAMLIVSGAALRQRGQIDLVFDARRFPGDIHVVAPPRLTPANLTAQAKGFKKGTADIVKRWIDGDAPVAERLFIEAKYPRVQFELLRGAMQSVAGQTPLVLTGGVEAKLGQLILAPEDEIPIFLRIDPPATAKIGTVFEFDLQQRVAGDGRQTLLGGSRYRVEINRKSG